MPEVDLTMTKTGFGTTVQELPRISTSNQSGEAAVVAQDLMTNTFLLRVSVSADEAPIYWSMARDDWLCNFVKRFGNDLLAGAMSTLIAKVVSTGFYVEGPLAIAVSTMQMLRDDIGFGAGWNPEMSKFVASFLNRDAGGIMENLRTSADDRSGPSMGFAHLDESKCRPTKDREYPIIYYRTKDGPIKVHRSQVSRMIDCSEPRNQYMGIGFCSVSRALATAMILMDLVRYKRERLSDLPPAGILMLNNLSDMQWRDILANYDARQENQGNTTWRDILVACGYDPAFPISAELFELSALPEHYDEKTATDIAIYTFALAFRVDPREYWPVSAGPLGTATESTIQHIKAKAKGEGIILGYIERLLNGPFGISPMVRFRFDFREDEDDLMAAEIVGKRIVNIRKLWETSPNDQAGERILTTQEARKLAVFWGCVPAEVIGEAIDIGRVYDVETTAKLFGPTVRAYRDGRVLMPRQAKAG